MNDISKFTTDFSKLMSRIGPDAIAKLSMPEFSPAKLPEMQLRPNFAANAVEAIYEEIADFEERLDDNHETGMPVVGGPLGLCVHIRQIYRLGSDKLVFVGLNSDGNPVRLIQHLSQLNLLLLAVKKLSDQPVRIGFHSPND